MNQVWRAANYDFYLQDILEKTKLQKTENGFVEISKDSMGEEGWRGKAQRIFYGSETILYNAVMMDVWYYA